MRPSCRCVLPWVLALLSGLPLARSAVRLEVRNYGAKGDGQTDDTAAIQRAVDDCGRAGGGAVAIPAGRYVTGTILLRSGVVLQLDPQAALLGSTDLDAYRNPDPFVEGLGKPVGFALIAAVGVHDVGLEGGTIDGRGRAIAERQEGMAAGTTGKLPSRDWNRRPFLVRFVHCRGVALKRVELLNSGAWTCNFYDCEDVALHGVTIASRGLPHNDGVDLDSCRRVTVDGCNIDSGDDAICLKTTGRSPCSDITVRDCTLRTGEGGIKLGTESAGDFERIRVSRVRIASAREGGIKLLSVDGGAIRDVTIEDVAMGRVFVPIIMRLGARLKEFRAGQGRHGPGAIEHVTLRRITASDAQQIGILVSGIPQARVSHVVIEDVDLQLAGGGSEEDGETRLEEKPAAYPEISMFGARMPAAAVYLRHVADLELARVRIHFTDPDLRPALVGIDANGLRITGWEIGPGLEAQHPLRFESVHDILVQGNKLPPGAGTSVLVAGADSGEVRLEDNRPVLVARPDSP